MNIAQRIAQIAHMSGSHTDDPEPRCPECFSPAVYSLRPGTLAYRLARIER